MTISESIRQLARDPWGLLVLRWNWKAALLSTVMRAAIFFVANLRSGLISAGWAMALEAVFRVLTAGFYASVAQAFRRTEPAWQATLLVTLLLPATHHTLQYVVHWLFGTPHLKSSMVASVGFTVLSTLFNYYAMRKGIMVVGEDERPLAEDLRRAPWLVVSFVLVIPRGIIKAIRGVGTPS